MRCAHACPVAGGGGPQGPRPSHVGESSRGALTAQRGQQSRSGPDLLRQGPPFLVF